MPNLAKLLASNFKKYGKDIGVKPCTLVKSTPGVRTPGSLSAGTNSIDVSYAATGFVQEYAAKDIDGSLIQADDRKISIFGASIASGVVPQANDSVVIADPSGVSQTYVIVSPVQGDGVGGLYTMQGRK